MIDSVIITLKIPDISEEYDLELPATISVKELAVNLLEVLKTLNSKSFLDISNIKIKSDSEKRFLEDNETLEKAAIWDGSILSIVMEE